MCERSFHQANVTARLRVSRQISEIVNLNSFFMSNSWVGAAGISELVGCWESASTLHQINDQTLRRGDHQTKDLPSSHYAILVPTSHRNQGKGKSNHCRRIAVCHIVNVVMLSVIEMGETSSPGRTKREFLFRQEPQPPNIDTHRRCHCSAAFDALLGHATGFRLLRYTA